MVTVPTHYEQTPADAFQRMRTDWNMCNSGHRVGGPMGEEVQWPGN
jgi:hypothetical protein